jgi:hypothetical protein
VERAASLVAQPLRLHSGVVRRAWSVRRLWWHTRCAFTVECGVFAPTHQPSLSPPRQEPAALLAEAKAGGFWSYAAGVAYHICVMFNVRGLVVDNYETTLPIAKVRLGVVPRSRDIR